MHIPVFDFVSAWLFTFRLPGFDNLLPGRSHSHNMAPQGNLDPVSGQGRCEARCLTCSSWGRRSNQALFVSQLVPLTLATCACTSVVTICHLTSLLIMPLLLLFGPISFLPCPLLVGGSCRRLSGPDLDQKVGLGSGWNSPATARRRIASRLSRSHTPTPIAASGAAFSRGAGPRLRGGWLARV